MQLVTLNSNKNGLAIIMFTFLSYIYCPFSPFYFIFMSEAIYPDRVKEWHIVFHNRFQITGFALAGKCIHYI